MVTHSPCDEIMRNWGTTCHPGYGVPHHIRPSNILYPYLSRCPLTGLIATAAGDDAIRIFQEDPTIGDVHQPSFELTLTQHKAHTQDVNAVSWNPKIPGLLASCSDDGEVKLWQFVDG